MSLAVLNGQTQQWPGNVVIDLISDIGRNIYIKKVKTRSNYIYFINLFIMLTLWDFNRTDENVRNIDKSELTRSNCI